MFFKEGICKLEGNSEKKDRGLNFIIKYFDIIRMEYSFGFMFVGFLLVIGSVFFIEYDYCVIGVGFVGL